MESHVAALANPLIHKNSHVLASDSKYSSCKRSCADQHWIRRVGTRSLKMQEFREKHIHAVSQPILGLDENYKNT